ncbi:ubiquitinyl hydrolase [Aureococcus anophagefferens]|nr:ubiquitinyl hydrolase [Aureococcus anophagefferens]
MLAVAGSGAAAASTLRPSSPLTDGDLEFLVQFDARVEGGVETIESSHFSEDNSAGVGLHNESSTCYLNALLQALFAVEPWRDAVLAWRYDEQRDGRETLTPSAEEDRLDGDGALVKREASEPFRVVPLCVRAGGDDVGAAMGRAHGFESLEGDDAWHCDALGRKVPAIKRATMAAIPEAWTLDRAASAAFAKCGAGDAAGNAPALRRLRVWDPARKSGGKTFRSKDDTSSLEALGLAPAADLVLETRKRDDPPFGHFDPRHAARVWAGGARLAAAALNNASDDDLEAAGLTCRDPADLEPANVARLRTDMDGVDALAIDRDARLFGGDELLAADEYHVKPPERRAARRVDEAATLRDAGVKRATPPTTCVMLPGPPREPGFFGVKLLLYDAKIAATHAPHDSFSSGVRVVAHEQATVRDLRSLVAEKLSDMADGLVKPVPKRLANALSAFDTVDIRRVRPRAPAQDRYAGKQLRDTMTLKKAIPDMESDAGEVALQIDPKGFDDAGDEGTCAIVLLMRAGDNHVIEAVVDRRATVADFDAVAKRALGDDDAVVSVGRAGARGKVTWQTLSGLEQDLPAGRPPYSLLREASPALLLRDAAADGLTARRRPTTSPPAPPPKSTPKAPGRKSRNPRPRRPEPTLAITVAEPAASVSAGGPRRPSNRPEPRNTTR